MRLIHDLRRFGINARVKTHERVVLQRASDVKEDVLDLIHRCGPQCWELFVLNFKDAFKQIRVHAAERKYLAGKALGG